MSLKKSQKKEPRRSLQRPKLIYIKSAAKADLSCPGCKVIPVF